MKQQRLAFALLALTTALPAPEARDVRPDYSEVAETLRVFAAHEREDKGIPGLGIVLVDDQEIVSAAALGFADEDGKRPLSKDAVFRVGSVSKLLTDVAVMQLVEKGLLDLDAPVTRYLPDFHPENPFRGAITLRMLMAHRSGLVREPPVGNYFDPRPATLADTVRSLNQTTLVHAPGQATKYSNAGIAVVGRVLERVRRERFAACVKRAVLDPLDMRSSAFTPEPALMARVPYAAMWTYDPRIFRAPRFELGMAPAGCLYASAQDLGRFLSLLFAKGRGPRGPLLKPETLEGMWAPAFPDGEGAVSFGLGFALGQLEGRRKVGHGGAIYGFATSLQALPEDKLGVVVVASRDAANSVTDRIAELALRLMLARRERRPLPEPETTTAPERARARRLAGRYVMGDRWAEIVEREGELHLTRSDEPRRLRLRARGDGLVVDDLLAYGPPVIADGESLRIENDRYLRVPLAPPPPPRADVAGLIGEYGWDHNTLYVLERQGRLEALVEWFTSYPLERSGPDTFRFPGRGLYADEGLRFSRDEQGRASAVSLNGIEFRRRASGVEGGSFRVTPLRPVADLIKEALAGHPPTETGDFRAPDLVELTSLEPTIRLDVRYATARNFLGTPVYEAERAFLQRPAAVALVRVHRRLAVQGFGLLIHDAYRPWYVTRVFWDATPPKDHVFVADPAQGSRHNRGCAVDLSLYDLKTGEEVVMPSGYDEMTERAYADYSGGTDDERARRALLRHAMERQGFFINPTEWWHFDYKDWKDYAIQNVRFEDLGK